MEAPPRNDNPSEPLYGHFLETFSHDAPGQLIRLYSMKGLGRSQ